MQLTNGEDLRKAVLNAPIGICILDAATLTAEIVNDKFLEVAGKPYGEIHGQFYWDAFAEARQYYEAALNGVVQSGEAYHADEVELMLIRHGREEMVFVTFVYSPIKDVTGVVTKVSVWVLENTRQVTERQKTEAARVVMQQERDKLKRFFMQAPAGICILGGPDLVYELVNPAYQQILAGRKLLNRPIFEALPELVGQPLHDILLNVYRTGEPYEVNNLLIPVAEYEGGPTRDRYFSFSYLPRQDEEGRVDGILVFVFEVTAMAEAQQEQLALNEELSASNEEQNAVNEELLQSRESLRELLAELATSEARTRSIVEAAPFPIGVYIGREMRVMMANQAIIDVYGKGNDVIGKLYSEILPELDNQEVFEQLDHVFTTGIPFEARNQRIDIVVDGHPRTFYFNYNFTALLNEAGEIYGVMNTAADVTDVIIAKQRVEEVSDALFDLNGELGAINKELTTANREQIAANKQLAEVNDKYKLAQDELQLAINAASLGTFNFNPASGKFTGNDLLKSWFGLQPEDEIELSKATDVIADGDRELVLAAIQKALIYEHGGDYDIRYTISNPLNPGGRIVRAKGKTLFNERHEPIRLSGVLQDITEQQRDEQRKNDFIGMVSHELKTPLTSLTAIVQVTNAKLKNSPDTFLAGAMEKANIQVRKMSSMINGFLNISRLESGKIQMEKKTFEMEKLIESIIEETKVMSPGYQISLSPCNPTPVYADPDKIGSVISNLLSNAVKYSPKGTHIELTCQTKGNKVEVSVHDEGIGIKKEDIKHLFDRYYR